ncbi:MAG: HPr(Ser) kinase/phosphatase, partial [Myxococcota bacterium]
MSAPVRKFVAVGELLEDNRFELRLTLIAGETGLNRTLENTRVQKSGLALAGFLESVRAHRLQVFGKTELKYLASLPEEQGRSSIDAFFGTDVAAVVVTAGQSVSERIAESANSHRVPLLRSEHDSSQFINQVQEFLDERLSPEETVHGVMMDVFGIGVLILGQSGIGKSECALDLILKGHRLIADDAVRLVRRRNSVYASSLELTKHHMEIRGLGVINVLDLYGAASVRDGNRVELVV